MAALRAENDRITARLKSLEAKMVEHAEKAEKAENVDERKASCRSGKRKLGVSKGVAELIAQRRQAQKK